MRTFKKIFFVLAAIVMVIVIAAYLSIDRISILGLSKAYNLDITYGTMKRTSPTGFSFYALKCIDKKKGAGFSSKSADIKADFKDKTVDFVLRDVRFIQGGSDNAASYDSLASLVAAPFKSNWQYLQMSGSVRPTADGLEVKSFTASGDEVKLTLTGNIHNNGIINSDITIHFSSDLAKGIPGDLSASLLRDEPDGWKSLTVGISGDYKKPSIQVTGKLFRLSIKEISTVK